MKHLAIIVAAVALLLVAFLLIRHQSEDKRSALASGRSANQDLAPSLRTGSTVVGAQPERARSFRVDGVAPQSISIEFETTDDLKAFVDKYGRFPKGADAKAFVARALVACQPVAARGLGGAVEAFVSGLPAVNTANNAARTEMYRARAARCRGFQGEKVTDQEIELLRNEALAGGSPAALAEQLISMRTRDGLPAAKEALIRVLDSRDPIALTDSLQFAREMGVALAGAGDNRRPDLAGPAWMLVACDFGADCSESGNIMSAYCVSANQCDHLDLETFLRRQSSSEQDFESLQRYRENLRAAILRRDWVALGLR